jgi:hypothetical protein
VRPRKFKLEGITWSEYLDHLIARLAGEGHVDDDEDNDGTAGPLLLKYIDPLTDIIYW